jgi:NAD(P)-dependent dehydrogenase (short-subunit alcohol dehydrogenase family)
MLSYFGNNIPLRRLGTPQDIAGPVASLVSAHAAYVTGQILSGGGLTMVA